MSGFEVLGRIGGSILFALSTDVRAAAEAAAGWAESGLVVRVVRGRKTRNLPALFDEFAAALQFPYYFGENWPAFDECLADLDWISPDSGLVILILDADQVLADGSSEDMNVLIQAISNAHSTYSEPIAEGEWWDRPALPFHVVLHRQADNKLDRWVAAGVSLANI